MSSIPASENGKDLVQYANSSFFIKRNGISPAMIEGRNFTNETLSYMTPGARADDITREIVTRLAGSVAQYNNGVGGFRSFTIVDAFSGIGGNTLSFLDMGSFPIVPDGALMPTETGSPHIAAVVSFEEQPSRILMLKRNIAHYKRSDRSWIVNSPFNTATFTKYMEFLKGCVLYFDPPWLPTNIVGAQHSKESYLQRGITIRGMNSQGVPFEETLEDLLRSCQRTAYLLVIHVPPGYELKNVAGWRYEIDDGSSWDAKTGNRSAPGKARIYYCWNSAPDVIQAYLMTGGASGFFHEAAGKARDAMAAAPGSTYFADLSEGAFIDPEPAPVVAPIATPKVAPTDFQLQKPIGSVAPPNISFNKIASPPQSVAPIATSKVAPTGFQLQKPIGSVAPPNVSLTKTAPNTVPTRIPEPVRVPSASTSSGPVRVPSASTSSGPVRVPGASTSSGPAFTRVTSPNQTATGPPSVQLHAVPRVPVPAPTSEISAKPVKPIAGTRPNSNLNPTVEVVRSEDEDEEPFKLDFTRDITKKPEGVKYPSGEWDIAFRTYICELLAITGLRRDKDKELVERMVADDMMPIWVRAWTHETYEIDVEKNYEQLENIGDALLAYAFKVYLTEREPDITAAGLSEYKARYMSAEFQSQLGKALGVGNWLITSHTFILTDKLYTDLFESFSGALNMVGEKIKRGIGPLLVQNLIRVLFKGRKFNPDMKRGKFTTIVDQYFSSLHWGAVEKHTSSEGVNVRLIANGYMLAEIKKMAKEADREIRGTMADGVLGIGESRLTTLKERHKEATANAYKKAYYNLAKIGITYEAVHAKSAANSTKDVNGGYLALARSHIEGILEFRTPRSSVTSTSEIIQLFSRLDNPKTKTVKFEKLGGISITLVPEFDEAGRQTNLATRREAKNTLVKQFVDSIKII